MTLSEYFATARGVQKRLAQALDIPSPLLSAWASNDPRTRRRVPAERCPAIERATAGQVTCEEMRPDVPWDVLRMQAAPLSEAQA
ncbi:YdaS family helix-turn-helix protein [uncultured Pseudacidovorax sp.]|uniref:transcriptional regulator n=1 Tax=uncultured Pseudacidovorax sp. TaxID=679313 RepID=UPI0025F65E89|nr:YdaS family helix-turn-helix protein [uncultured Pseudacidovorax sp.]